MDPGDNVSIIFLSDGDGSDGNCPGILQDLIKTCSGLYGVGRLSARQILYP